MNVARKFGQNLDLSRFSNTVLIELSKSNVPESARKIGKELIYLKEITPHGQFGELVEWAYGIKEWLR